MMVNIKDARKNLSNVDCGDNVKFSDFVNIYGCKIGDNTKIGSFVEIQSDVEVGANCKIQSHSFICEGVKMGDGVFVGHGVVFINDKHPRAVNARGEIISGKDEWKMERTVVEDGVSIGSGAIIMGGVSLGKKAVIGAGAVVLHDVLPEETVVGNPARAIGE